MATLRIEFTPASPAPRNGYKVKYRALGTTTYTTVVPNATTSPIVINNVAENTSYEGLIIADCSDGFSSSETPFSVAPTTVIPNFDFLVARYYWAPGEGTDLDTLTGFTNTGISSIDNNWVGWSQGFTVPGDATAPPSTIDFGAYLQSAGDNRSSGAESVLINFLKITTDNPSVPNILDVQMYAFWFGSRNTGNALFEIIAYKGGTMSKNEFEFTNTGGNEVYRKTFTKNVTSVIKSSSPSTSTLLGTIKFNKTTKQAELVI